MAKANVVSSGFDLSKNDFSKLSEAGYEFELTMPTDGSGTGAFITVRGDQSPIVKQHARKKFAEYQAKQAVLKRKGKEDQIDLDELEESAVENAVVRIIGWKGIVENGVETEFNTANATRILTEHSWIREQVLAQASDLLNFRPK